MTRHRLDPTPETTRDVFSRDHAAVLTVDPGDTVTVRSLDASGYLARQTCPGEVQPRMFAEAVISLAPGRPLGTIHAEAPGGRMTFGFDADLNVAMGDALDAMVTWLQVLSGLGKAAAPSTCVDMRITQVANQTWGVHAVLPDGLLGLPG
jgi:acetamidase/formamidase